MTDKCWFVLRHSHHSPPNIPTHGIGKSKGALSIGHVITSTKLLDIINSETGPVDYPPSMPVVLGRSYNLEWNSADEGRVEVSTKVDAPVAAISGVDIGLSAAVAFKQAVNRCWEFERLETFTVNITQSYVDDTMETPEIEKYIDTHKAWLIKNPSLYIITGIMVGRTAKLWENERKESGVNCKARVGAFSLAGAGGRFEVSRSKESWCSGKVDDFVFAIRVAKVTKGLLDRTWSWTTLAEGATFGADDNREQATELIRTRLGAYGQVIGQGSDVDGIFIL